jgi:hypothetical protein
MITLSVEVKGDRMAIILPKKAVVGDIKQAVYLKTSIPPVQQKLTSESKYWESVMV